MSLYLKDSLPKKEWSFEGVVPFQIQQQQATQFFEKWLARRWFSPRSFNTQSQLIVAKKIYLPYWVFQGKASVVYHGRGGLRHHQTIRTSEGGQSQAKTQWRSITGRFQHGFKNIFICASKSYPSSLTAKMKPSQVDQIIPHADHYLSGAGVEPATLSLENVWELAYSEIESQLRTIAKEEIRDSYDEVEISHLQGELDSVDFQPFLFPVWVAEYVYQGKAYLCFVNGETGSVFGKSPVSPIKIGTVVLIAGLCFWGVFSLFIC